MFVPSFLIKITLKVRVKKILRNVSKHIIDVRNVLLNHYKD